MPRKTVVDFQLEKLKAFDKYYRNVDRYLKIIKSIAKEKDRDAKLIIFGSYIKGGRRADSDIDVLIVTDLAVDPIFRARLRMEISRRIGEPHPFELHIITTDEYERWYRRFIDRYEVIK